MLVLKNLYQFYYDLFVKLPDRRSDSLFLMRSPLHVVAILVLYFKFVTDWGPKFMKNRPPFKLDKVLIAYNFVQICLSSYIFAKAFIYTYGLGGYSFICQPIDTSFSKAAMETVNGVHFYFLLKIFELIETVFFVLRKKHAQTSFLHVYHHMAMVISTWCGTKFLPGGQSVFLGYVNCIVHVVMYTYYLVAALKPKNVNFSKWKKYITQLQMLQFLLIALNGLALIISPYCGYPKFIGFILVPQNAFMFALFLDFYVKCYWFHKE